MWVGRKLNHSIGNYLWVDETTGAAASTSESSAAHVRRAASWLWRTNEGCDRLKIGLVAVRGIDIESRYVELDRLE